MGQIYHITPRNVFVSFTGADRKIKNKIVEYLQSKNITCLESDKDCCGDYREWSIQAQKHCALFLPIITENVRETSIMKDEYEAVKNTYKSLKEQDKEDFFNRIIPITTNLEIYKKHSFGMSENVSAVLETNLPDDIGMEALEELCRKIEKLLIHMDCRKNFNPGLASEFFRGRASELEKIRKILNDFNAVFISGIGGIGKTELAKKYVEYQRENENSRLTVLHLKYDEHLGDGTISPLESIINSATEKMPIANKKEVFNNSDTLVILDNFDVENDKYLDEFLSFNCKKIITTRNKKFSNYEHTKTVEIGALSREEQYELFKVHYGDVDKSDANNLKFILDAIDGVTIFIPIIAKQCDATGINLEGMCERLKAEGIVAFKNAEKVEQDKDRRLLEGNTLEIARIIFKIADLGENYKNVLRNLSLLQFMKVNADLYKEICMNRDIQNLNDLNWLIKNCWVIENRGTTSPRDKTFELHPIINDLVREDLKPNPENCKEIFEYIENKIQKEKEFYDKYEYIVGARHKYTISAEQKRKLGDLFAENLDFTIESNYYYAIKYISTYVCYSDGMSRILAKKLKQILLGKLYYNDSDIQAVVHIAWNRENENDISAEEAKVLLEKCKDALKQGKIEKNHFLTALKSFGRLRLPELSEILSSYWNEFFQKETRIEIDAVDITGAFLKFKEKKSNIIASKYFEEGFEILVSALEEGGTAVCFVLSLAQTFFNAFSDDFDAIESFLYKEFSFPYFYHCSEFFERIYPSDVSLIFQVFLNYCYNQEKNLPYEHACFFAERALINNWQNQSEELSHIFANLYCNKKESFKTELKKYMNANLGFSLSTKELICRIGEYKEIFDMFKIEDALLLPPILEHVEDAKVNEVESSNSDIVLEQYYDWIVLLAEKTANDKIATAYSDKLKKLKAKRRGFELRKK